MKRLLILGSVEDFTVLTKEAVKRGIYTVVVDSSPNGEAKQYANKSYDVSIDDEDGINSIIKYEKIDHILTSYSDNLFEYMVKYSDKNNLPCYCSIDKVRYLRDKFLMKEMLNQLDIPIAPSQKIDLKHCAEKEINISYPFVVKPVDGWGSKGIYVVNNYNELKEIINESANYATDDNTVLLEEKNIGHELNIMSWVKNGKITFAEFSDREVSGGDKHTIPHYNRVIFPSVYREDIIETVRGYLLKVAEFMGIKEGPLSTQLFFDKESGKISIGEVAGRFFGVEQEISRVINGVSLNSLLINMAYNPEENINELNNYEREIDHCSLVVYIKAKKGVVRDLGNIEDFIHDSHIDKAVVYAYPGVSTTSLPVLMCVYAHFDNRKEADEFTANIYDKLYIPGLDGENLAVKNYLPKYE